MSNSGENKRSFVLIGIGGVGGGGGGGGSGGNNHQKAAVIITRLLLVGIAVSCVLIYNYAYPFDYLPSSLYESARISPFTKSKQDTEVKDNLESYLVHDNSLQSILTNASMEDNTVIITTLNQAWAEPGSMFDLFLESFRMGNETRRLLKHLVVVATDAKAYERCKMLHPNCYALKSGLKSSTEAYFMSSEYLKMMWIRIRFLTYILELGYNFVFTDTDIMWFRDPFPQLHPDVDIQIACDYYKGKPYDLHNAPNGGFNYVRSNNRTIQFYRLWYSAHYFYPKLHDQDVLNKIKFRPYISKIRLKIRFLDTAYFGGFCQPSRDLDLVCTMHANCCYGLENKVRDLKIVLDDWKYYTHMSSPDKRLQQPNWHVPYYCSGNLEAFHPPPTKANLTNL